MTAVNLSVSKAFLSKMERGHKPLITKALQFIDKNAYAGIDNGK